MALAGSSDLRILSISAFEGVFVVGADNKVTFKSVKVGIAGEKYFEVISGLKELSGDALLARAPAIWKDAECDLIDRIPARYPEALGIWILSQRPSPQDD